MIDWENGLPDSNILACLSLEQTMPMQTQLSDFLVAGRRTHARPQSSVDYRWSENHPGKIRFGLSTIDIADNEAAVERCRRQNVEIGRLISAKINLNKHQRKTYAPFNGPETCGALTPVTIATDQLPIGSIQEIMQQYNNDYFRTLYLHDKAALGYSYTGTLEDLGILGAALIWDIEHIQNGQLDAIQMIDDEGSIVDNPYPQIDYPGIKILYKADGQERSHTQYSYGLGHYPEWLQQQLFNEDSPYDILYLRGTHCFTTSQAQQLEYYIHLMFVAPYGFVVADTDRVSLTMNMPYGPSYYISSVDLPEDVRYGYASKDALFTSPSSTVGREGKVYLMNRSEWPPDNTRTLANKIYNVGNRRNRAHKKMEALKCYLEAIRLDPIDLHNTHNAAAVLEELGDYSSASNYFKQCALLTNDRDQIAHYLQLAEHLSAMESRVHIDITSLLLETSSDQEISALKTWELTDLDSQIGLANRTGHPEDKLAFCLQAAHISPTSPKYYESAAAVFDSAGYSALASNMKQKVEALRRR